MSSAGRFSKPMTFIRRRTSRKWPPACRSPTMTAGPGSTASSTRCAASSNTARNVVLACSALRQAYRDRLARAGELRIVYLRGDQQTIASRLALRRHRYMPATLLASQFATLEPPLDAIDVDIRASVAVQVQAIVDSLDSRPPACSPRRLATRPNRTARNPGMRKAVRPAPRTRDDRIVPLPAGHRARAPWTRSAPIPGRGQHTGVSRIDDPAANGRRPGASSAR